MNFPRLALTASLLTLLCFHSLVMAEKKSAPSYEPTSAFEDREINGWHIKLNRRLATEQPEICAAALRELDSQLYQITRVVREPALSKIRKITIWLDVNEPNTPCACFHPDIDWLQENNVNPDKLHCVELANAENFVKWSIDQPWMVLHELAHGYHHQFLENGYRNGEVRDAYEKATSGDHYGKVISISGRERVHYSSTSPMEYFAETSEAYFGVNDYFPFVRSELKQYDPTGYALVEKLWGGRVAPPPSGRKNKVEIEAETKAKVADK